MLAQHVQDQSAKCRTSFADDGADMGPTREQARRQPTHVLFASVSRLVNSICSFCSGSWYVRAVVSLRQGQRGEGRLHAGAPTGLPCCSTSCRGLEWQHSPFAMHRVDMTLPQSQFIANMFDVRGYPTLKLISHGNVHLAQSY